MRIGVGSDHRGFEVKEKLVELLKQAGHEVVDVGTHNSDSVDYPDIAAIVAKDVSQGIVARGILICGTGIGMCITANKFPGVRAAACNDLVTAEMSRRHNDLNVLCLSGHLVGQTNLDRLLNVWLETDFEGGRHTRRLEKISQLEGRS